MAKTWTFASDSNSNRTFTTTLRDDGTRHCTCHGAKMLANGSMSCKHTRLIDQGMADEACISSSGSSNVPQQGSVIPATSNAILDVPITSKKAAVVTDDEVILPQLLTPVEEAQVEALLKSSDWGAQEKIDGKRILLKASVGEGVVAYNRKGKPCDITQELLNVVDGHGTFVIDGEWIESEGNYYVFDILDLDGEDLRGKPYQERHTILMGFNQIILNDSIITVPLITGTKDKRALFNSLKSKGREGIVFKVLEAPHEEGRGANQLKFKFYETVSCMVTGHSDQKSKATGKKKSSVSLGLKKTADGDDLEDVGNCTIPAGWNMPDIGTVVEIRYLYAYKGGSLYQPTFLMERDDVGPDSLEDLKFKSEDGGLISYQAATTKKLKKTGTAGPTRRILWKD